MVRAARDRSGSNLLNLTRRFPADKPTPSTAYFAINACHGLFQEIDSCHGSPHNEIHSRSYYFVSSPVGVGIAFSASALSRTSVRTLARPASGQAEAMFHPLSHHPP
eukprot:6017109-Pleurochrysis_carterae.AAC.1